MSELLPQQHTEQWYAQDEGMPEYEAGVFRHVRGDEGGAAIKTIYGVAGLLVVGVVAGKLGLIPGYGRENDTEFGEPHNPVIVEYYTMNEQCVGGFKAKGTEVAKMDSLYAKVGPLKIPVPHDGVTSTVEATVDVMVCQKSEQVKVEYKQDQANSVVVTVPGGALSYHSSVDPGDTHVKYSDEFVDDLTDPFAAKLDVFRLSFLEDIGKSKDEALRATAEAAVIDAAQIGCAQQAYDDFIGKRFEEVNKSNILSIANALGVKVGSITVVRPNATPKVETEDHTDIMKVREGKIENLKLAKQSGPACERSDDVIVTTGQ